MGILRRLFGPSLKAARAAEAQGDLREAVRLYGEAEAWEEVISIQLRLARLEGDAQERLHILRAASICSERLPSEDSNAKLARSSLAKELLALAKSQGTTTDLDRRLLEESVRTGTLGGAFDIVGEALLLLGQRERAAQAFAQAGQLEKMETLYQTLEQERKTSSRIRDAFDRYESAFQTGDRRAALDSIRQCTTIAPEERSYTDLQAKLEKRLLPKGLLPCFIGEKRVLLLGKFPADIGRETGCLIVLRDPSISRAHARISSEENDWVIHDLSSRNGTFLSGLKIASPLPLRDQGSLRFGERASFDFSLQGKELRLLGSKGLDRETLLILSKKEIRLPELLPGLRFCFQEEFALAFPDQGTRFLFNGKPCVTGVMLIEGDELEVSGKRMIVTQELTR